MISSMFSGKEIGSCSTRIPSLLDQAVCDRVPAMLRRKTTCIRCGEVLIDFASYEIRREDGTLVHLRPQSFDVLKLLHARKGMVVEKREILDLVWGTRTASGDSLFQCIRDIRQAIGDHDHSILESVPRIGYRLATPDKSKRQRYHLPGFAVMLLVPVALGGYWWTIPNADLIEKDVPRIAVTSFKQQGSTEKSSRLAYGLTDDLTTDLARFSEFEVMARDSVAAFDEGLVDLDNIQSKLDVDYVVSGGVRFSDDEVTVTASLLSAESGTTLWTARWQRNAAEIFDIQSEIVLTVANRIGNGQGVVEMAERRKARRRSPENLSAYENYLLGTERLVRMTIDDLLEARRLLRKATDIEPSLARAWVELYHTNSLLARFAGTSEAAVLLEEASRSATTAVELDPADAEAHAVYAMALLEAGDLPRAEKSFQRALELSPNSFEILVFYAHRADIFGKAEEAAEIAERAIRLNPQYPEWSAGILALALHKGGRHQRTLELLKHRSQETWTPTMWVTYAHSLTAVGRQVEAESAVEEARSRFPWISIEAMSARYPPFARAHIRATMEAANFPR